MTKFFIISTKVLKAIEYLTPILTCFFVYKVINSSVIYTFLYFIIREVLS